MAQFISSGKSLDYTPTADVAAGDVVVIGDIVAVAPRDIPANALGSVQTYGVFEFEKASSTTFAAGAKVYFNAGTGRATSTNTDKFCGHAVAAAASGSTAVQVLLDRVN